MALNSRAQSVLSPTSFDEPLAGDVPFESLMRWGPVTLHPRTSYSFVYGTDIQSAPGQGHDTTIQTLSPGMLFNLGERWTLDYSTSLILYSSQAFENNLAHNVVLSGSVIYDDWVFSLSHAFSYSSEPLVETGTQTTQQTHSTSVSTGYAINSRASLSFGLSQSLRFVDGFNNSRDWSTSDSFFYQLWPELTLGIGGGAGYVDVAVGSDQTFESVNGSLNWHPGSKLSISANAGGEVRQFSNSDAKMLFNPTFGLGISYPLSDSTSLSLSASRSISASYFADQVTESTSVDISVTQRLFGHFNLSLSAGYSTSDYEATDRNVVVRSTDSGYHFGASLGTSFLKRGSISTFYSYSQNSSSQSQYQFGSMQVGVSVSYGF